LAKRLDEVFKPGLSEPQNVPRDSAGLKLLQRVRDESHRFAVTYHRALRKKRTLTSELIEIPGVGEKRRADLLKHFRSVENIKAASVEELAGVSSITPKLARAIFKHLHSEAKDKEERFL
jgi:excinuclease ABC subunit C